MWQSPLFDGFCFFSLICCRSGLLAGIRWSICLSKSQRILCFSITRTDSCFCIYHLFPWSNLNFLHDSQKITFPTRSSLVLYFFALVCIIIISSSRHTRCFKQGLKPGWLYVSRISLPRFFIILSISEGIFTYIVLHICYRLPECSIHEKSLHLRMCGSRQFPTRVLNPLGVGEHIYCHPHIYIHIYMIYKRIVCR